MMSDKLRAAAQAALEMLDNDDRDCAFAANILRAALAEPAIKESLTVAEPEEKLLSIHRLNQWLKASLAEQKPMLEMNPQKREWVGLTDEEIEMLIENYDITNTDYARAIEAKLRQKNT